MHTLRRLYSTVEHSTALSVLLCPKSLSARASGPLTNASQYQHVAHEPPDAQHSPRCCKGSLSSLGWDLIVRGRKRRCLPARQLMFRTIQSRLAVCQAMLQTVLLEG